MCKSFAATAAILLATLCWSGCQRAPKAPYLVYVSNEGSGDMTVIDPNQPQAVATLALGKRPRGIHASGGLIFVALSGSPAAPPGVDESTLPPPDKSADGIGVFDPAQGKIVRKLPGGSDPEQFALSPDGKLLYVANEDAAGVSIVEVAGGKVLATLATGEEPEGVTLSPDGKFVYVTSENDGTVAVIDRASRQVVKTIKVGRRPRAVAFLPDGSRAFVTNENGASVSVLDCARGETAGAIALEPGQKPMGLAITKDGATLYVSTGRGKKVVAIDTASQKPVAAIEVGDRPWGIALSPDEKLLFTANGPSNDVSVVDVAARKVIRKIKAGDKPWGVIALPRQEKPTPRAAEAPHYFDVDPAAAATLRGKVLFRGKPVAPRRISMDAEEACEAMHKAPVFDDKVLAAKDGGLANVFVYIKSGLEGKVFAPAAQPAVLDQRGCQFQPRVIGLRAGQTLAVKNSDPVAHNVHPKPRNNRDWNQQQPPQAPDLERRFPRPEIMIPVKCDVHGWMRCYIGVVDHPFFAVTDRTGGFALPGLPAGQYTVAAWHEVLGELTETVTLQKSGQGRVELVYR